MYGYVLHFPAPIDAYLAMHKAVLDTLSEDGGGEGLLDAFNRDVFPKAMSRAGLTMDGPQPAPVEFEPAAVMTPRAFNSEAAD